MNQHDFVKGCLAFYEEDCLTPEKGWDVAHYPAPENQKDETIWLSHDHHQIQGLLQSREYGQCCFFAGDAKRFLTKGPFVPGWFELWDIYDEYTHLNASAAGKKAAELRVGIHAPEMRGVGGRKGGKIGGAKTAELGVGAHAPEVKNQKYRNTHPEYPPFVSNAAGLERWHRARGIDPRMRVKVSQQTLKK
jgi:hypothetical protein